MGDLGELVVRFYLVAAARGLMFLIAWAFAGVLIWEIIGAH